MGEHVVLRGQRGSSAYYCQHCGTQMGLTSPTTTGIRMTCEHCGTRLLIVRDKLYWQYPPTRHRPAAAPGS